MNTDQHTKILDLIETLKNSDFEEKVVDFHKETKSLIGEYTTEEFIALIKRIFNQLKNELISKEGNYIPYQYNFQNEYGNSTLESDIQSIITSFDRNQFSKTIPFLKRLIYLQRIHNFWDQSTRKFHNSNEINAADLSERINHLEKSIKSIQVSLLKERDDFNNFTTQKKEEIIELETLFKNAQESVIQINSFLHSSKTNETKIQQLEDRQNEKLEDIRKNIGIHNRYFEISKGKTEKHKLSVESKISEFDKKSKEFDKKLDFVEKKKSFFEERIDYLENLIGREVGASLFETFKQRKVELNKSVNFWKWTVPIMTILTICWTFSIFYFFSLEVTNTTTNPEIWRQFILNTLKLIPVIVLLFFTIRQYSKERDFQEEYAFKSAVALTIDAYSQKVSNEDRRDDLIISSVSDVFKSPVQKKLSREALKSKSVLEGINVVKDTVSDVAKNSIEIAKKTMK
jgi:hypothetical protein